MTKKSESDAPEESAPKKKGSKCSACGGSGNTGEQQVKRDLAGDLGEHFEPVKCPHCGGSGIEPASE